MGEYRLADETYTRLLAEVAKPGGTPNPELALDLQRFFAKPAAGASLSAQVRANLALLKSAQATLNR
jgi:hypothetical protein